MDRQQTAAIRNLAAAAADGLITLPAAVSDALATSARVAAAAAASGAERYDLEVGLARAATVVAAAAEPAAVATAEVEELLAAEHRGRVAYLASEVLDGAALQAQAQALRSIRQAGDEIVTGGLQPALVAVLAEARTAAKALEGRRLTVVADLLGGGPKVATAYQALAAASERYRRVRGLQVGLQALGYRPNRAEENEVLEERAGWYGVWTARGSANFPPGPVPWPDPAAAPLAYLAWLATAADVEPWCPTLAQQGAAYVALHEMLQGQFAEARKGARSRARAAAG